MMEGVQLVLRWLLKLAGMFLLICATLLIGRWLAADTDESRRFEQHQKTWADSLRNADAVLRDAGTRFGRTVEDLAREGDATVQQTRRVFQARADALEAELNRPNAVRALWRMGAERYMALSVERRLLLAGAAYLGALPSYPLSPSEDRVRKEERLRQANAELIAAQLRLERLKTNSDIAIRIPGHPRQRELKRLEKALVAAQQDQVRATEELRAASRLRPVPPFAIPGWATTDLPAAAGPQWASLKTEVAGLAHQAAAVVRPVIQPALIVLLGVVLLPLALRGLFFYTVAPLAQRRPPIHLGAGPSALGAQGPSALRPTLGASAASLSVRVPDGHELRVRQDYRQSTARESTVGTAFFLARARPFMCLVAGLALVDRFEGTGAPVVGLSGQGDLLREIATLDLPAGCTFVIQPRALVGVLQRCDAPMAIRSYWRLFSLQAWLTLQLRYLAFEGPGTLIVRGCRGVRLEAAGTGRAIDQRSTLGFTANAAYSVRRSPTFAAYLLGHRSLFDDQFSGVESFYLHEQQSHHSVTRRSPGGVLEAIPDAVMKAFGL